MRSSFLQKCKPKITRISALPNNHQKKCYDLCLYGRAKILVIFGVHFWRNDDLINSF